MFAEKLFNFLCVFITLCAFITPMLSFGFDLTHPNGELPKMATGLRRGSRTVVMFYSRKRTPSA
jgi:hypothetical protein